MHTPLTCTLLGVVALAGGLATAGCAGLHMTQPAAAHPGGGAAAVTAGPRGAPAPENDPVLLAAARTLDPLLRSSFPDSYAGLELDQPAHRVIVHRVPDPALDAAVAQRDPGGVVELRDANYPLPVLMRLVDQVIADSGYWAQRGVRITGAAPKVDGSGVTVLTAQGGDEVRRMLAERYGADRITVEQQDISLLPGRAPGN